MYTAAQAKAKRTSHILRFKSQVEKKLPRLLKLRFGLRGLQRRRTAHRKLAKLCNIVKINVGSASADKIIAAAMFQVRTKERG